MIAESITIGATTEVVYGAFADARVWKQVLPNLRHVELRYDDGRQQEVRFDAVREVRFLYPRRRIEFFRPEPPVGFRSLRGIWSFEPTGDGRTRATACVLFELTDAGGAQAVERALREASRRELEAFRRVIETRPEVLEQRRERAMSNERQEMPPETLMKLICGQFATQMVAAAAHMKIADRLAQGPASSDEVAASSGTQADPTYRLMRGLSTLGVLDELDGKRFALTPVGQCLRSDVPGSMAGMAKFLGEGWHSAVWCELMYAMKTGKSPFQKVHGRPVFDWFGANPEASAVFNEAMTSFSKMTVQAVVATHDFSGSRRIVDVGGGHGLLLSGILSANPQATGILFDLPSVAEGAKQTLSAHGVESRCEVMGGDFFKSVPRDGDIYLLQQIIHDWGDEQAVAILSNIAQAMKPGARVLLVEEVMTPPGVPHFTKLLDLEMLLQTESGRERTEAEYAALFTRAGLKLERVVQAIPTPMSLIEATRA